MAPRFSKTRVHAATALLILILSVQAAQTDPAIVMGRSICDNQADSFDYRWTASNVDNTKLFFLSGNSAANGAINAVGDQSSFNASDDIYIAVHGALNVVDTFSGTDFATLFLNNHQKTPNSVTFYVCQSGTPPHNGVSSMAAVARSYPGEEENSTLIGAVNAPGPNTCPALAVNAANQLFDPINNISAAVYRTDVSHTDDHNKLLDGLVKAWGDKDGTPYPGTKQSYEGYCRAQLTTDPKGAWVPDFIANVAAQFSVDYLALINTNYGGDNLETCGPGVQCN